MSLELDISSWREPQVRCNAAAEAVLASAGQAALMSEVGLSLPGQGDERTPGGVSGGESRMPGSTHDIDDVDRGRLGLRVD